MYPEIHDEDRENMRTIEDALRDLPRMGGEVNMDYTTEFPGLIANPRSTDARIPVFARRPTKLHAEMPVHL